ncbi:Uncharacterised protein [uncultured Roseburia sp.]|uniref:ABC transporter permease n=1 Tax=Brotonthovivens ammoniilytica TaxID=2981725 RepID=A0ABT2THT5_9FIRM|nr:hypothetical protein [Brotonthovivens ammoniilytica]MCU6761426.1 hypothetical protein [Brotonthovivens ammoniilytica]SCI28094.1 Uncharacterised protein [uncultured Roseburia sp.]
MFKSFCISFRLKNTYRVNSIIYSLKQFPGIRRLLPQTLYQNRGLKILGNVLSILWEIVSLFLFKGLYLGFLVFAPVFLYEGPKGESFLHIFFCLTIIGGFLNTYMFNPTNDKYYAMVLMRMDAGKYTLSNYMYEIGKLIIGFLTFMLLFGRMLGLPYWILILAVFFASAVKVTVIQITLRKYDRTGDTTNENLPLKQIWILAGVLLAAAYGLPCIGVTAGNRYFFLTACLVFFISAFVSVRYIRDFSSFSEMYKQILAQKRQGVTNTREKLVRDQSRKAISQDTNITSNKSGFEYFNELFIRRHQKILWKPVSKMAAVCLFAALGIGFLMMMNGEVKAGMNKILMTFLPYFAIIMYLVNRGLTFTRALFMNCDHSMLTYSFYKEPKFILKLFQIRLRELVKMNLIPAVIIAAALPVLLYLSGGTEHPWNYVILSVSILAMSVFFSVHYLTCYYLLQPYNAGTETKSSTYQAAVWATYLVCVVLMQVRMPTFVFGIMTIVFCVAYCILASILVYKLAYKTFKLRT